MPFVFVRKCWSASMSTLNLNSVPGASNSLSGLSGDVTRVVDLLPQTVPEDCAAPPEAQAELSKPKAGAISQPCVKTVPLHLGRTASNDAGTSAAGLRGTKSAGITIKAKATVGAFANPAGWGVAATLDATATLDTKTTLGLQFKETYTDQIGNGPRLAQSRLRLSVNRVVFQDPHNKLTVGGRVTAAFRSNLDDGSSNWATGVGLTAGYTHTFDKHWSAGVSGSVDLTFNHPSRGPANSNWKAEGEGNVAYTFGKDQKNVLSASITGYKQVNNNGTDLDALAVGIKYLRKLSDDVNIAVSAYQTAEGSHGGVDDTYSPLAGGTAVKVEVSGRF
jgi:hypothetical protein